MTFNCSIRRANMKLLKRIFALTTLGILFAMFGCATVQKGDGLSEQEIKAMTDQLMALRSGGDLAQVDKLFTPDCTIHFVGIFPPIVGPEAIKRFVTATQIPFPDLSVKIDETITKGDRIIALYTLTGTNTGPGQWPPTGKKIEIEGVSIIRVVDGKIDEELVYYNFAALLTQLGFTITPP
jgi:steroid delta-isomerase-like uncharacterized protein